MRPLALLFIAILGCGDPAPSFDCAVLPDDCTPLYEPNFEQVFDHTLQRSCGVGGSSCHAAQGAQGGLVLDEIDTAYSKLLSSRVVAGDRCSVLMKRLHGGGVSALMPPGAKLGAKERCSVQQWIVNGARR
jgi:hypothetical protein